MLKYFVVSRAGHVSKPQLYKKLKAYANEDGAEVLTKALVQFSSFYMAVRFPEKTFIKKLFEDHGCDQIAGKQYSYEQINHSLEALREFGITQFCPVAYAALNAIVRTKGQTRAADAKALIRLFVAFERYHFINNAVCERVGNEVERLYADTCVLYSKTENFMATTDQFIAQLKARLATEEEFITNFVEITYSPTQLSFLAYIFDRINNSGLDPSQFIPIYSPDLNVLRRNQNIEHWMPQRPESDKGITPETRESIDNVGNLLAISYKTNSRLGNDLPVVKVKRLKGELRREVQNLVYVDAFLEKYGDQAATWDKAAIDERARDMARDAYRQIWKIS